ncbi:MAG: endonuclease [Clostridia bacterium]|nr:endonuclease [Clostridia bacterium]
MQKIFKNILSLCLVIAVCIGTVAFFCTPEPTVADAATNYYSDITAKSGTALLGQLHDLITTKRTKYSTYNDCKIKGSTTDPGSASNTVMEFYTHIDIVDDTAHWDVSGGWNREHVWPKADSNGLWKSETVGGGSDLHHVRPAEKVINNSRANKLYGTVGTGGKKEYPFGINVLGGYSNSTTFEPMDNVKGDVARILMYVYTHYNTYTNSIFGGNATTNGSSKVSGYLSSYFGTLNYTHIIAASSESAAIKLLLQWNKLDPVDQIEINRNEAVYKIQGNRNPFIDNETYAEAIWGNGTVTPPVTSSADVEAFHNAVAAINGSGKLTEWRTTINTAVEAYKKLSADDKTAASADVEKLRSAIASYNEKINAYNSADEVALKGAGVFFNEGA